ERIRLWEPAARSRATWRPTPSCSVAPGGPSAHARSPDAAAKPGHFAPAVVPTPPRLLATPIPHCGPPFLGLGHEVARPTSYSAYLRHRRPRPRGRRADIDRRGGQSDSHRESGNRHDRLADRGTTGERHHRPDQGLCLGDERQPEPEHQVLCQRLPPANLLDRFLSDWLVRRTGWTPSPQCSCLTWHHPGSLRPECFDRADCLRLGTLLHAHGAAGLD